MVSRFSTIRNNNRSEEMIFRRWSHSMTHSLVIKSLERPFQSITIEKERKKIFFQILFFHDLKQWIKRRSVPNKQTIFLNNEATQCLVIPRTSFESSGHMQPTPHPSQEILDRPVDDPASILPFLLPFLQGDRWFTRSARERKGKASLWK